MKSFVLKLVSFLCFSLLLSMGLLFYYSTSHDIEHDLPAPNLSNNLSLNEKLLFLRKHAFQKNILAIGSSMALNNLHSETIVEKFQDTSYLNAASWGSSMKDNFLLIKTLAKIHHPHTLMISSYNVDFTQEDKIVKWQLLEDYLTSSQNTLWYYHLRCFNLSYYEKNIDYVKKIRTNSHHRDYMGLDAYGAVAFDRQHFTINPKDWGDDLLDRKPLLHQYAYLDSIALFCKEQHMTLLFFQSPVRKGLYQKFSKEKLQKHHAHISRLQAILHKHDVSFVNTEQVLWDDSLFVDAIHLNADGAKLYTAYCLGIIASLKKP